MKNMDQLIETERRLTSAFNSVIVLIILSIFFYLMQQCDEEPVRAQDQVERKETILRLSQCVIGECDHCKTNPRERDAIGWCLKKQAWMLDRSLLKQTIEYCAFYKRKSRRAIAICNSKYLDPLHGKTRLWLETKVWAEAFVAKPPPDPLPRADQWGGDMDIPRAKRLGLKRIAGPPEYANTFYRSKLFVKLSKKYENRHSQ